MSKFEQYLMEVEAINSTEWNTPLYHGTSLANANKIFKLKQFSIKDSGGVDEIGRGVYLHPSMNRTSPWVKLSAKNGKGAFVELHFTRPLKLAYHSRNQNQRQLMDAGFDGIYDKSGNTQVPHQVLLFNSKSLETGESKLNSELIDWNKSRIINFDDDKHGYLSGMDNKEEYKWYH
jgi:hypothetical protein